MKYHLTTGDVTKITTDCLAVGVFQNGKLSSAANKIDKATKGVIKNIIKNGDFSGSIGKCLLIPTSVSLNAKRIILIGLGKNKELTARDFRKIIRNAIATVKPTATKNLLVAIEDIKVAGHDEAWQLRRAINIVAESCYQFNECKSIKAAKINLATINFWYSNAANKAMKDAVKQAVAVSSGMDLCRNLANRPANVCTPSHLAMHAKSLANKFGKLKTKVLDEKDMKKLGMNALLSVSNGSKEPAKFIIMEYSGGKAKAPPHVLVGKGITFDSGGISLKQPPGMDAMKFDMCGAASVVGTMQAIAAYGLKLNVIGVIAASENLPSGTATKPGDIIKSLAGITIEILNTDAEGRLVLCDALAYVKRYKPASVVDIATLTSAMIVALGNLNTGVMSNNQKVVDNLISAGMQADDPVWQLPMDQDYHTALESNFADIANSGGRAAGSITAACFLSRFAQDYPWAHLDIAGTAWYGGKAKGASGRPVPLLVQYLLSRV